MLNSRRPIWLGCLLGLLVASGCAPGEPPLYREVQEFDAASPDFAERPQNTTEAATAPARNADEDSVDARLQSIRTHLSTRTAAIRILTVVRIQFGLKQPAELVVP